MSRLVVLFLLFVSMASALPCATAAKSKPKTHYDVLEIPQGASLKDIKKAYRKLAVQHHPDRNLGNEEEATIRFREISEAYEILSDEQTRKQYDKMLKYGGTDGGSDGFDFNWSTGGGGGNRRRSEFKHRDPFAQFNDVFKNDPFFADARKSMDDLFDKHFSSFEGDANANAQDESGGGIWSTLKKFMPEVNIQTTVTTGGSTSTTSRSYSSGRTVQGGGSTYTSRSTRTTIENGQRVTIQSLEKDGNRIEEKYVGNNLIERKINGLKQDIGKIGHGEF